MKLLKERAYIVVALFLFLQAGLLAFKYPGSFAVAFLFAVGLLFAAIGIGSPGKPKDTDKEKR